MKKRIYQSVFLLFLSTTILFAQDKKAQTIPLIKQSLQDTTTHHKITLDGKTIEYTSTAGYLTLFKENGEERAKIFYVAHHKKGGNTVEKRPLTFSFNGGPGSCSVWLHLGVLGPKRVLMTDEGETIPPPYQLVNNDYSWLDETDMVFIDPVSTGFSRAVEEKKADEFHGYTGDIESVGAFIRQYISEHKRWASPKFIIGESYGTTRASGLVDHLMNRYGMYMNGVILVSAITNFQTARFTRGNDLPYPLFLPTYAASAYYHKQLSEELLAQPLADFLDEVENFALNDYTVALMKGDLLSEADRQNIIEKLHQYTSLSKTYIDRANLRINIHKFNKELLREKEEVIGRFDSRYKGVDKNSNGEYSERDPSYQPTIQGCFSAGINDYLTRELGFETNLPYEVLTGRVRPWDYSNVENRFLNVSENLRRTMVRNPHMKVWVANGYYDLATPYFATEYTINHMGLAKDLKENITMTYYPAGHMMYLLKESLVQMKEEAKAFYRSAVGE